MLLENGAVQRAISNEESAILKPLESGDIPTHHQEDTTIACEMMKERDIAPSLQQAILKDSDALGLILADDY